MFGGQIDKQIPQNSLVIRERSVEIEERAVEVSQC